jgi:hypothetical protein
MADKDRLERTRILKSRFTEVIRQAAAETTLDIYNMLKEVGCRSREKCARLSSTPFTRP